MRGMVCFWSWEVTRAQRRKKLRRYSNRHPSFWEQDDDGVIKAGIHQAVFGVQLYQRNTYHLPEIQFNWTSCVFTCEGQLPFREQKCGSRLCRSSKWFSKFTFVISCCFNFYLLIYLKILFKILIFKIVFKFICCRETERPSMSRESAETQNPKHALHC